MDVTLMTHDFKSEPLPFPACLSSSNAGHSPGVGLLPLFPQIAPLFPASPKPAPHPGSRAGDLLLCPILASPPPSPLSGPAVSCLVPRHGIHLATRTASQTSASCFRLYPQDRESLAQGMAKPLTGPHTLWPLFTGPLVDFVGGSPNARSLGFPGTFQGNGRGIIAYKSRGFDSHRCRFK